MRVLSRGDNPKTVIQRIVDFRADDKPNPEYYARLTVTKAQDKLNQRAESSRTEEHDLRSTYATRCVREA
jgi:hypothetical protein